MHSPNILENLKPHEVQDSLIASTVEIRLAVKTWDESWLLTNTLNNEMFFFFISKNNNNNEKYAYLSGHCLEWTTLHRTILTEDIYNKIFWFKVLTNKWSKIFPSRNQHINICHRIACKYIHFVIHVSHPSAKKVYITYNYIHSDIACHRFWNMFITQLKPNIILGFT